jgi:hypothetical protein
MNFQESKLISLIEMNFQESKLISLIEMNFQESKCKVSRKQTTSKKAN